MSIDQLLGSGDALAAIARPDYRRILDALPAAIYATDKSGILTYYNNAAQQLAGRTPQVGVDQWCVTHKLLTPDGQPLPHDQCPMAVAIRERRPVRNVEVLALRPDGEVVPAMPFPTPLLDEDGEFVGAINMLVDLSALKRVETSEGRRAEEQAALYQFTDRLYRAGSLEDICAAALDAIIGGLHCDRASILLFDAGGVMRFVAWRGLSDGYRAAVDGHSPWRPGDRDPTPIFVPDILASDQSEELKQVVTGEGIRGLGFIPLVADGMVIGKFMTYHDARHAYSAAEVALAVTISRQLGFSVQRVRAEAARNAAESDARRSVERLRLATAAGKVGLWDWDIPANSITWTDSIYAMHGLEKDQFTGTFEEWLDRVHPEDRPRVAEAVRRAVDDDAPYELELRSLRADGGQNWIYAHASLVRDGAGRPHRMVGASVDITERKASEAERELLLAELSHRVKNTLATVISIAHQSFARDSSSHKARTNFEARIRALAQTHTRLAEANWHGVHLHTLLHDELAPYRVDDGANVHISGPVVALTPRQAIMLGMGFSRARTNAAKYGALSQSGGRIEVVWRVGDDGQLQVSWAEAGGPEVRPEPNGFGRVLLERALAAELRGSVQMDFAPRGVSCAISIPLDPDR